MATSQPQRIETGEDREEGIDSRCLSFRDFLEDSKLNKLDFASKSDHIFAGDAGDDFAFTPSSPADFPLYPVFGYNTDQARRKITSVPTLEDLLAVKEDDHCGDLETDDLDDISPETYCLWNPKNNRPAPTKVMGKSKSTGTSMPRRWRLRDLFVTGRSRSDGKKRFIFLSPSPTPPLPPLKTSRKEVRVPLTYQPYRSELTALFPFHRKHRFFGSS